MSKTDTQAQISTYVCELCDTKKIGNDVDLFSSGVMTSLKIITLIQWLESVFSISVGREDLKIENFRTISDISVFVGNKKIKNSATA